MASCFRLAAVHIFTRGQARLVLPLLLIAFTCWLAGAPGQDVGKKKLPKPEVEDPNPKPIKKVNVDDPVEPKLGGKQTASPAADLAAAARQSKHPTLQDFFFSLAYPHDRMVMRQSGVTRVIEPAPLHVRSQPRFKGTIKVRGLNADWIPTSTLEISSSDISDIEPYELFAVGRAERFLSESYDRLREGDPRFLSRQEMLQAAAQALTYVVGFHESARARGVRLGEGWEEVDAKVRQKLLDVELQFMNGLVTANDWEAAEAAARRLAGSFRAPSDREVIAGPLTQLIDRSLKSGNDDQVREAHRRLKILEEIFPDLKAANQISDSLRRQAEVLFDRAKKLRELKKFAEARAMLRQAEDIYPRLPELHDYRLRLEDTYPILRVGVRELPVLMAPSLVCTDSERYAVELLFEGLVKLGYDPETGQRYEPALTEGRPTLVPMGRQFQLTRDAFWSADRRVTAADVRSTVRLMKDEQWPGHQPAWAELVDDVQLSGDPFQVSLLLRQGFLDPLSLMTFKILPPEVNRRNLSEFARRPIGSGPYVYRGQETNVVDRQGVQYARYMANPNYSSRAGKGTLPNIREIHFIKSDNPIRDLEKGQLDLLLDLPAKKVRELKSTSEVVIPPATPNRRVYFLAINHRRPALQDQELRRALGLAVPRERLLDDYFRPEGNKEVHRALNGPYPTGSWACDPTTPSLDQQDKARALLRSAEKKGTLPRRLTLKYPNDDPAVDQAMRSLGAHWTRELGIEITPEPLGPHALRDAVEGSHLYDLAYYHYDYPSDSYWLWPMFDPSRRALSSGGGNFLGYANDADLARWFQEAMGHRDFNKVQEYTRLIHGVVESKMLLIPLWQLDTIMAYRRNVKPSSVDPTLIFNNIENWRLERR